MRLEILGVALALAVGATAAAAAEDPPAVAAAPPPAPAPATAAVPAGYVVEIEIAEVISSKVQKIGDMATNPMAAKHSPPMATTG